MAIQGPGTEKGAKPRAAARPAAPVKARPSGGVFVGIDIGAHAIKAVEVKGFGPGLTVTALNSMKTPAGAIQAGRIMDPKALGAALKSFLQKNGIRGSKVIASVAGVDGVVVRVIEVPRMTPTELKEAMRYEVERSIPFAITDVEMDYQAIDDGPVTDATNPNMEVLFAAAQRDLINRQLTMYQAAGLDVKAVDIEPLAVGRAIVDLSKKGLGNKNVVVVNAGASVTEVAIFKNGILRFPRSIPIAGDNFTRAISDQLGLTMEAAEDEKLREAMILMDALSSASTSNFPAAGEGFGDAAFVFGDGPPGLAGIQPMKDDTTGDDPLRVASHSGDTTEATPVNTGDTTDQGIQAQLQGVDDPFARADIIGGGSPQSDAPAAGSMSNDPRARRRREIFDALLPVLSEFAMEVRRSIDYFRSRYPTETVDQIVLCGGSAKLGNLDKYLEYEMGIPTEVGDPFQNVTVTGRQISGASRDEVAPAFAIALGLAARDAILGAGR